MFDHTPAENILQTPRCSDDDLRPAFDQPDLASVRAAAVDGDGADTEFLAVLEQFVADLVGQFARRDDDERLDTAVEVHLVHDGQAERGSFAGAGLRLADDIAALEDQRDRLLLYRTGNFESRVADALHNFGLEAELFESGLIFSDVGGS